MMRLVKISAVAAALTIATAAVAHAQTFIDMKGNWSGTAKAIVEGLAAHHPAGDGSKPAGSIGRLDEVTFRYKIEGQDGQRFWGTLSSPNRTDPVIGVIVPTGSAFTSSPRMASTTPLSSTTTLSMVAIASASPTAPSPPAT